MQERFNTWVQALRTPLPLYPPPPLRPWGRIWRYGIAIIFGVVSFLMVVGLYTLDGVEVYPQDGFPGAQTLILIDIVLAPVMFLAMALRRKRPLLAIFLASIGAGFCSLGSGAVTITLISVATRRQWRELVPAALLWFFTTWGMQVISSRVWQNVLLDPEFTNVTLMEMTISSFTFFTIMVALGLFIGGRRQAIGALEARVAAAEDIRDARLAQARATERSSIAREMHDVLAHRISLVALHSGALSFRTDLTQEQVAQTAEIIRDNSHQALKEVRTVLGVLRDPNIGPDEAPDLPQPTLADLDTLIRDSRMAGSRIRLEASAPLLEQLHDLDATISRNAYRVIQECLTNARKHAPHAMVVLGLTGTPLSGLTMTCSNGLRSRPVSGARVPGNAVDLPSSGLGLVGMQERIRSSGGTLEFGASEFGIFEVKAWLPWSTT